MLDSLDRIERTIRRIERWMPKQGPRVGQMALGEWLKAITPAYNWDWAYLMYLRSELERVTNGDTKRLMVMMPPRHGKSAMVTVRFPVWWMERQPGLRVIVAAYNQTLANKFSRMSRKLAQMRLGLREDRRAVEEWETQTGCWYRAVGVGGGITGMGGNCLPEGTLIITDSGDVPIEKLNFSHRVLSYDHNSHRFEFKRIQGFSKRESTGLYRITTLSGRVVEATGEHPFWTARGYIQASDVATGDTLLCMVRKGICGIRVCDEQKHQKGFFGSLLFKAMFRKAPCREKQTPLQNMRKSSREENKSILRKLPSSLFRAEKTGISTHTKEMSRLQFFVSRAVARWRKICEVLLEKMFGDCSFKTHVGKRKPAVEARNDTATATTSFSKSIQKHEKKDFRERWTCLCHVWFGRKTTRSSHRQLSDEQHFCQFNYPVSEMPYIGTLIDEYTCISEPVISVETLYRPSRVYDIQVEDNHNYFANGILVHNCIIIDDPIKSREEAQSLTYREKVWDWYTNDLYTRLEPGGAMILVMTRWHEDDLAGRILSSEEGENWRVVKMPALAEDGDVLGRQPGEALNSERYPVEELLKIKAVLGSWAFEAFYQQRPMPAEGGLFKREWFAKFVEAVPTQVEGRVRYWDKAATADDGDYTVGVRMSRTADGLFYVEDVVRGRWSPGERDKVIKQCAETDPPGTQIWLEQEPGSSGVDSVQALIRMLAGYSVHADRVTGSKVTRAEPLAAQCEAGNVVLVKGHWNALFLDELLVFPNGQHDDQVDAASGAFSKLTTSSAGLAEFYKSQLEKMKHDREN